MTRRVSTIAAVVIVFAASLATTSAVWAAGQSGASATAGSTNLNLAGRWSGKYSGAYSGTFNLHWTQAGTKLTGTIALSKPKGTYDIGGSVHGRAINFGAVGVGATYKGSASSTKMSGTYTTPGGGGTWSAHKCKPRQLVC